LSASICQRRNPIYAIVRSGGRQYRVEPDQTLDVDRLAADVGTTVDLGVLMLGGDGEAHIGKPILEGARVVAEVIEHVRGAKILVFKYKNKTRYRRRYGHRQDYTRLSIKQIVTESGTVIKAEERKRPRRLEVTVEPEEAPATEAMEETTEEAPKPRRIRAARPTKAETEAPAAETAEEARQPGRTRTARPARAEAEAPEAQADEHPVRRPRVRKATPPADVEAQQAEPDAEGEAAPQKPARRKPAPKADTEGE
jgi:large subunit ribosomal protein L21